MPPWEGTPLSQTWGSSPSLVWQQVPFFPKEPQAQTPRAHFPLSTARDHSFLGFFAARIHRQLLLHHHHHLCRHRLPKSCHVLRVHPVPGAVFSCTTLLCNSINYYWSYSQLQMSRQAQGARVACWVSQSSRVSEAGSLAQPHTPGSRPSRVGEPSRRVVLHSRVALSCRWSVVKGPGVGCWARGASLSGSVRAAVTKRRTLGSVTGSVFTTVTSLWGKDGLPHLQEPGQDEGRLAEREA